MGLLSRLERRFGRYGLPNVTIGLILGQTCVYALSHGSPDFVDSLTLIPEKVLEGEFWRLFTFPFIPPVTNVVFAFFAWYLFYLMGMALERQWGTLRYNIYLLIAYVATLCASCITPAIPATNAFIGGSVFLAFAFLYPNFQILLFFLLPVKVRWLALLTWIGYGFAMLTGTWSTRLLVTASVSNYLLFFGRDIVRQMKAGHRRMEFRAKAVATPDEPFHSCAACGITEKTNPDAEFRYCMKCVPACGYCQEHINAHTHVEAPETSDAV